MNTEIMELALAFYGLEEAPGAADNPMILQMAHEAGFPDYAHDSEAWCSAFANYIAFKTGYQRSKSLAARSWLNVGQSVTEPAIGDIVVLWRDDPHGPFGHVGFFTRQTNTQIFIFGGNQGNKVCIEPFDKGRLLGYRRLAKI